MKKITMIVATAFLLLSCNFKKEKKQQYADSHTSELSLNWDGTYSGILPCASCSGILTTVKLNDDKTYESSHLYLAGEGFFAEKGNFSFTEDGGKVELTSTKGEKTIYQVGENRLILLNKEGKENESELAGMYQLTKMSDEDVLFSNQAVKGTLVLGHEVASFAPCGSSKSYWIQDTKSNELSKRYREVTKGAKIPYMPVFVELVVKDMGVADDGFAEQYDGVLQTVEVKSIEPITPENYCK